jgi:hypothetical protein
VVANAASRGVAFEFGAFKAWFFLSLVSWVKGIALPTLWFCWWDFCLRVRNDSF